MSPTTQMTDEQKTHDVREYARHTTGSSNFYTCPLVRDLQYTDGVAHLAETCGAYWLVDLIASHQPAIRRKLAKLRERDFQVWRLRGPAGEGDPWIVDAWTDTPEWPGDEGSGSKLLATQEVEYSDFPLDLASNVPGYLGLWVENGTLLLKEER